MSKIVTYSLYTEVGGVEGLDLTPVFTVFRSTSSGADLEPTLPAITSLGNGFYKYEFDWELTEEDSYLVKIDLGESVPPGERYIVNRLERHDYLPSTAAIIESNALLIKASADRIETATGTLVDLINYMLDMEQGSWKIINNQLVIYNPNDEEMMRHQLLSFTGAPTSTNPYQRNKISITIPRPEV
jgi:hypothetical protein